MHLVDPTSRPTADGRADVRGPLEGPGVPALARHHRVAGRDRRRRLALREPRRVPPRRGEAATLTGRVVGALWWDRAKGLEQIDDLVELRERGRSGPVRRHERQDHAGRRLRELHGRDARPLSRRARAPDRQPRDLVRRARAAEGGGHAAGRARVPGALPRARRTARSARRSTRSRPRARPTASTTCATTSRTSRSSIPTTCRGSARWVPLANAQPLWAAHEAQMDELTIPFLGEPRWTLAVPVRLARAPRRDARDGHRTGRSHARTRWRRSHVAVNRQMPSSYAVPRGQHEVFLPDERSTSRPRSPRSRWARPTRTTASTTPARSRPASAPTSRCSTATSSPTRPTRSRRRPLPADLRRGRAGVRGRRRLSLRASWRTTEAVSRSRGPVA